MKEARELLILILLKHEDVLFLRQERRLNLNADHDLVRLQRHPQLHLPHFETFLIT